LEVIQQISDTNEWEQIGRAFVCISIPDGDCMDMLKVLWEQEIGKSDSGGTLMRKDSFGTKMWAFYCRCIGLRYLFSVLAYPITELNIVLAEKETEYDSKSVLGLQTIEV
jgi:hypothetical protein